MDELQDRLARVGLDVLAGYGFALAGGYALQAHQLVDRMSEDIDMFTNRWDPAEFGRAVDAVSEAYRRIGLEVSTTRRAETFARLQVTDPRGGRNRDCRPRCRLSSAGSGEPVRRPGARRA